MSQRNREKVCKCCGKHYLYCYHCDSDKNKPTWMTMFHDENCLKIFYAVTDYNVKEKTKEESKKVLESCDLTNKDNFVSTIVTAINEILDIDSADNVGDKANDESSDVENATEPEKENKNNIVESNDVSNTSGTNNTSDTNNKNYKSSKKYQNKHRQYAR